MQLTSLLLERLVVCMAPLPGCKGENHRHPLQKNTQLRMCEGCSWESLCYTHTHTRPVLGDLQGHWQPQLSSPQCWVLSGAVDLKQKDEASYCPSWPRWRGWRPPSPCQSEPEDEEGITGKVPRHLGWKVLFPHSNNSTRGIRDMMEVISYSMSPLCWYRAVSLAIDLLRLILVIQRVILHCFPQETASCANRCHHWLA